MGMRINTNVTSLAAQRSLRQVNEAQSSSLNKLSSGSRINKAADDAAGLAISEKLKTNIKGIQQATRNAGDGISLVQVAEGGLNEISNILGRLRELSVQAASDTVGEVERGFANKEFQQLKQEVERIALSTEFNGRKLLNGSGEVLDFQIGSYNNDFNDRIKFDSGFANATADNLGIDGMSVASKQDAQANLDNIDAATEIVNSARSNMGALQNRLSSTVTNLQITEENLRAANSRIRDADIAFQSSELTKNNILQQSAASVLAQANSSQTAALKLIG